MYNTRNVKGLERQRISAISRSHILTLQSGSRVCPPHQHILQIDRTVADLPFVTSISRSLPILMLLLGSHRIPLLRFRVISPAVVEKCTRVLD
jgi:hypothetical protein